MDDTPFKAMLGAVDTLVVWDYSSLTETLPLPKEKPIHLVAWSMGVWAATQVFAKVPLASATAVNGTPRPIDDTFGIPEAIFDGTLATLSDAGLARFRRRMCGGATALKAFLDVAPQRSLEDLRNELACLGETIRSRVEQPFAWTRAYIGSQDKIFPPEHQQRVFPNAERIEEAHWAPNCFASLLNGACL